MFRKKNMYFLLFLHFAFDGVVLIPMFRMLISALDIQIKIFIAIVTRALQNYLAIYGQEV
ncbi:hypothetical protein D7X33_22065 [Butyricicoccus sp. 1XD8-22]|nr:hypothetical protein D7X33_22065 [Butyricicoccus sp. 1XD8-22]